MQQPSVFKNNNLKSSLLIALLLFISTNFSCSNNQHTNASAAPPLTGTILNGRVVGVSDGDTFTLLTPENKTVRIRLFGVDAPEKGQDYGTQAKAVLSQLVFGAEAQVQQKQKDRYGRVVGIAWVNGKNINEMLLRQGAVWHYTQFDRSAKWAGLQKEAQETGAGLWRGNNPTPPWEWRKNARQNKSSQFN